MSYPAVILVELAARPKGGEGVKSGPIALAVILVLCVVAYFLFKSMSKHLKRVRDEFPTDQEEPPASTGSSESRAAPADGTESPSGQSSSGESPSRKSPSEEKPPRADVPPDSAP
jgi:hypothetical protein